MPAALAIPPVPGGVRWGTRLLSERRRTTPTRNDSTPSIPDDVASCGCTSGGGSLMRINPACE